MTCRNHHTNLSQSVARGKVGLKHSRPLVQDKKNGELRRVIATLMSFTGIAVLVIVVLTLPSWIDQRKVDRSADEPELPLFDSMPITEGLLPPAAETRVPVIGAVEPGASSALAATKSGHLGVIGTLGTVRSQAYAKAIATERPTAAPCQAWGWFRPPRRPAG